MPYDDPDPTDPMTLTGVEIPVDSIDSVLDMATCFIEEYVRSGLSANSILEVFVSGEFAGPSLALHQLGRDTIDALIREQFQMRGPHGPRTQLDQTAGGLSLPVLER